MNSRVWVTSTLRAKGKALYERLRCGACHGATGGADGPAVQLYRDPEIQDIYMTLRGGHAVAIVVTTPPEV